VNDKSKFKKFPDTKPTGIQSRTAFDSFYPMEIIPLASEKKAFLAKFGNDYLVFPEDRAYPIRMKDEIPLKWVQKGPSEKFSGDACKNEYYAFQIGVFASKNELKNIKVEFSTLGTSSFKILPLKLNCFNTGGTDPYGKHFEKRVDVAKGAVQALWIGIDIPENIPAGFYKGLITLKPENAASQTVEVSLKIGNKVLADRGDNEPWRHSRLRWLNSMLGIDDKPTKPYESIEPLGNNVYRLTDKQLTIDRSGMPGSIQVTGTEILAHPLSFIVESNNGSEQFSLPENVTLLKNEPGVMSGAWESHSKNIEMTGTGVIESDGYINYKLKIKALKDVSLTDIRLEIPFINEIAQYMMGMGLPGTIAPKSHQAKWKGPYDSFWVGNTNGGIWCELRGGAYNGPLLNLYHPAPPVSWFNNDNGGFRIEKGDSETKAVIYSGKRELKVGENIDFEWSLLITPVKKINYRSQFTDR
jgi:hypothetical protein